MTSNVAETGGFLKTRPDLAVPDIQFHFCIAMADDHGRKRARGTVLLPRLPAAAEKPGDVFARERRSAPPPGDHLNFFGEPDDLETMVAGFKLTRLRLERRRCGRCRTRTSSPTGFRTDDDIRNVLAQSRRHGLPPGRHLQDGRERSASPWSIRR